MSLFQSRSTKERRREFEVVVAAIRQHASEASREIRHAEQTFDQRHRYQAANILCSTVVYVDRTIEAIEARSAKVEPTFEAGRVQHAFGIMLGTRLVMGGILLARLAGQEWLEASIELAHLEGLLRGFMERNGVQPWPVMYAEDFAFERYRREYIENEEREEREALAEYQNSKQASKE